MSDRRKIYSIGILVCVIAALSSISLFWPSLVDDILVYVLLYKYATLFLVAYVAACFLPIPSGSVLMAASAFASVGYFDVKIIFLVSVFGNILGDISSYFLAKVYGRQLLHYIGLGNIASSKTFRSIQNHLQKKPELIIFISRFEVISTLSVNFLAGITGVSFKKFIPHEIIGTIAQVVLYATLGYLFGENWQSIDSVLGKGIVFLIFVGILVSISFGKKYMKKIF